MVLFCAPDEPTTFAERYPHIHVVKMPFAETWTASFLRIIEDNTTSVKIRLPTHRNEMKDTREFLTLMNAKPDFMATAIEINPWKTALFAWVDFNVTSIFSHPEEVFDCMRQQEHTLSGMHIPGCLPAIVGNNTDITQICANSIQWRFVGGFFIGKPDAILHWVHQVYRPGFMVYMTESEYTLTWEVNLWAWLEARYAQDWKPEWYSANHNDTIVRTPILGSDAHTILSNNTNNESWSYACDPYFQTLVGFHATTPSYVYHPILDRHYLVIRYVNYWINHTGAYVYSPETCADGASRIIITKNLVYELDEATGLRTFSRFIGEMNNNTVGLVHRSTFSDGLEDLRLAWNANTQCIRFVATTSCFVPNGKSRIIVGDFDPENLSYGGNKSCTILQSPGGNDVWCEKNWVPISIPLAGNLEVFVYKWTPHMEFVVPIHHHHHHHSNIGTSDSAEVEHVTTTSILVKSTGAIDIMKSCGASHIWRRDGGMRGSSVPVFSKTADQWFAVVHASDDTSPRRYFHRFSALHKDTYLPVRISSPFSFIHIGIEFCIGLAVVEVEVERADDTDHDNVNKPEPSFICWFSQMDRDPVAMSISMDALTWSSTTELGGN